MAKIKAGEIIEHLAQPMRKALEDALTKVLPGTQYDPQELFKEFRRAVGRRCRPYEIVPESYVDCD